ncbi:MAG: alkaline phosphatase D family protein [Saprospiraceae bacterium]
MKIIVPPLLLLVLACLPACAPKPLAPAAPSGLHGNAALQSGPMLGYVDMFEALLWIQTKGPADVVISYWELEHPGLEYRIPAQRTVPEHGFTAKLIANQVQPGRNYGYRIELNGAAITLPYPTTFKTQALWQYRTDPPAFALATGSCAYINEAEYDRPGKPYGGEYQIFTSMAQQKPDVMLWLGDNTYYREPDWNTRTGMLHRYTHTRSLPEMQPLLAVAPQYAIWDDHDFGPNDADGTWIHKAESWEVFRDFWGNPTYGLEDKKGCTTRFQYADVDFFLLDNRYFRSPDICGSCPNRTLLGHDQLEWFLAALASSTAPFKMVAIGGQVVTTNDDDETCFHYFPAERDTILARIERDNVKGVVFLTGDRHFTELSAQKNRAGNWVYDLTTSPFTSGPFSGAAMKAANDLRIPGTVVEGRNFSILRFSGPRKDRQMEITVYDVDGKPQWSKTVGSNGEMK